jgi:membrane-associated phospholipid phosphatase
MKTRSLIARPAARFLAPTAFLPRRRSRSQRTAVLLSHLGSRGLIWIAIAPVVAAVAKERKRNVTAVAAATTWAADGLALALREVIGRDRPCNRFSRTPIPCPPTPSFPSDHAAMAAAGAGILCRFEPKAAMFLVPLASGIAYSRAYAGVHHVSDVHAGALLGGATAFAAHIALRRLEGEGGGGAETPGAAVRAD